MENDDTPKSDKPTKRLAVLETADHADEMVALAAGQDRMEYTYPTPVSGVGRPGKAFHKAGFGTGHNWEKLRPLEAVDAPMPVIDYGEKWRLQRGRFGALKGFGPGLRLLLARRPY